MADCIIRSYLRFAQRDQQGQGLLEYALIIMLVALVVFAALTVLGPKVANMFNAASNSMNA